MNFFEALFSENFFFFSSCSVQDYFIIAITANELNCIYTILDNISLNVPVYPVVSFSAVDTWAGKTKI